VYKPKDRRAAIRVNLDPDRLPCQISIMRMVMVVGVMMLVCAGAAIAAEPAGFTCSAGCDDADPCTTDVCDGATCRHDALPRAEAVDCACQPIGETACTTMPRSVRRQHASACRLLDGGSASARRVTRAQRRAENAWNRSEAAAAKGKLSDGCRDAVRRQLGHLFDAMAAPAS